VGKELKRCICCGDKSAEGIDWCSLLCMEFDGGIIDELNYKQIDKQKWKQWKTIWGKK